MILNLFFIAIYVVFKLNQNPTFSFINVSVRRLYWSNVCTILSRLLNQSDFCTSPTFEPVWRLNQSRRLNQPDVWTSPVVWTSPTFVASYVWTGTFKKKGFTILFQVREETCVPRSDKYCEKLSNEFPFPVEKQNCHSEPMKKCELGKIILKQFLF